MENKENLNRTLGIKNLRITNSMHRQITKTALEDDRNLRQQVRQLIKLGLEYRTILKKGSCQNENTNFGR
jgi:predicted HicB family RNase H-like nuclease